MRPESCSPAYSLSKCVCVCAWGNEKGEVEDQITATLISTQEHDKRVQV